MQFNYFELKKILIIQTAFIGDVILATSLIEKLHQTYPNVTIDFLLKKGTEGVLNEHPFINNIFILDKSKNKFLEILRLIKCFKKEKYDLAINVHRFGSSGLIAGFSGANKIIGFKKNPFSFLFDKKIEHQISATNFTHEINRNQKLIEEITDSDAAKPKLYPTQLNYTSVITYQKSDYVCMAPASVWFTKQLPIAKWVELINSLDKNVTIYLIGAKNDIPLCESIANQNSNHNIQLLAGKLNMLESAALMEKAKMNYVNDSAPLHICSAMNAPVTAFFCSTVPSFGFTPLSDNSKIVESEKQLDCHPCGLHGFKACPKGHFECGNTINILK